MAHNSAHNTHPQLSNPSGCCPLVTFPVADFFTNSLVCVVYKRCLCSLRHPGWAPISASMMPLSDWLDDSINGGAQGVCQTPALPTGTMLSRGSLRWEDPVLIMTPSVGEKVTPVPRWYHSASLRASWQFLSISFPGQQRGSASGGSYKQPEGRALWLEGPPSRGHLGQTRQAERRSGPMGVQKDCVGPVWMLPPRVVLLRKSQQTLKCFCLH